MRGDDAAHAVLTTIGPCDETAVWWALSVGDRAFFTLSPGWTDLWVTDGTPDGTAAVGHLWVDEPGVGLAGVLYLSARGQGGGGQELWRSDGTSDGTYSLKDIRRGETGSFPGDLVVMGDRLHFAAAGSSGRELWTSGGTEGGTVMVKDIRPDGSSSPSDLVARGSRVYFSANDGTSGRELRRTDGTASGTRRV